MLSKYSNDQERAEARKLQAREAQRKYQARLRQARIDAGQLKVDEQGRGIRPQKSDENVDPKTLANRVYMRHRRAALRAGTWYSGTDGQTSK